MGSDLPDVERQFLAGKPQRASRSCRYWNRERAKARRQQLLFQLHEDSRSQFGTEGCSLSSWFFVFSLFRDSSIDDEVNTADQPKPRLARVLLTVLLVLVFGLLGSYTAGCFLAQAANQAVGKPPADLDAIDVRIPSESGSLLAGWLLKGESGRGAILLLHGIRSNRWSMVARARWLHGTGYTVLLIDFQAHGESPGKHVTFGFLESKDVEAAARYLRQVAPGERLGVIAASMSAAGLLVARHPLPFQAVILEAPYPTIDAAVRGRLRDRLGPPGEWLAPLLLMQLYPRMGFRPGDLQPVDHLGTLNAPVLILGGGSDPHPTPAETRQMFEEAMEPKELWIVPGLEHVDLHAGARSDYEQRVGGFLTRYLRDSPLP